MTHVKKFKAPVTEEQVLQMGFKKRQRDLRWYFVVAKDANGFKYTYAVSARTNLNVEKDLKKVANANGIEIVSSVNIYPREEVIMPIKILDMPTRYHALIDYIQGETPKHIRCGICKKLFDIDKCVAIIRPHYGTEWKCARCYNKEDKNGEEGTGD